MVVLGFPGGSESQESACNVEDLGSIPGLERSHGEGKSYPLQYSGLENSMDCIVHGVAQGQTRLKWLSSSSSSMVLGSDGEESACNVEDLGSVPGLGRSPGGGNGNPLQYSCLGNPMDRATWWAAVHGVAESDMTEQLSIHLFTYGNVYVSVLLSHFVPPSPATSLYACITICYPANRFISIIFLDFIYMC